MMGADVKATPDNAAAPADIIYSLEDQKISGRGEELAKMAFRRGVGIVRETVETPAARTIRLHAETFSPEQAIANGRARAGWK